MAGEEQRILSLLGATADDALDMPRQWAGAAELATRAEQACLAGGRQTASELVERFRSAWVTVHDRFCDIVCALFSLAAEELGESVVGAMWDDAIGDMYPTRDEYATDRRPGPNRSSCCSPMPRYRFVGISAGRGAPERCRCSEEEDRWVFRFEPCGSGGRTMRADANADGAARVGPPFGFRVTTQEHDWAWRTKGVCLYCAHCCQLQERASITRLGYPVRVVEPPVWGTTEPRDYCTWSVYKDPPACPGRGVPASGRDEARGGRWLTSRRSTWYRPIRS